ncbi:MAG: hypothetical protein K5665_06420 [Saccharofermentans sp.]|nr:hypothetical protein [Saccharofermentans sp.]
MNPITQFLSELSLIQYILLYLGCFVLAVVFAVIGAKTKLNSDPFIAIFSVLGGMLAVAYVTIIMKPNISLGILIVLTVFACIIAFPSLWISKKISSVKITKPKPKDSDK